MNCVKVNLDELEKECLKIIRKYMFLSFILGLIVGYSIKFIPNI